MSNETQLETIRSLLAVQGENGNWNCNPYMMGMYNGMECVLATLERREPKYKSKPENGWLDDKVPFDYIPTTQG